MESRRMRGISPAGIMVEAGSVKTRLFFRRERGGAHMPRYVVLVNWTDQGIRNVKHTAERTDHGGEVAEKHGLKLEQAYWTVGAYDMVTVFEAPDDEALSGHLLEIGSLGNVRTTTLRAYDEEEMLGIVQRLSAPLDLQKIPLQPTRGNNRLYSIAVNSLHSRGRPRWRAHASSTG